MGSSSSCIACATASNNHEFIAVSHSVFVLFRGFESIVNLTKCNSLAVSGL
jgi:hypothetical protein